MKMPELNIPKAPKVFEAEWFGSSPSYKAWLCFQGVVMSLCAYMEQISKQKHVFDFLKDIFLIIARDAVAMSCLLTCGMRK